MKGQQTQRCTEELALRLGLLRMEAQPYLPWPTAILVIALISLATWGVLGGIVLLFR